MNGSVPVSAEESPIAQLMLVASGIAASTPASRVTDLTGDFARLRHLLWQLIENAPDPASYLLSWNTLNLFATKDLDAFILGDELALARFQDKVRTSVEFLP